MSTLLERDSQCPCILEEKRCTSSIRKNLFIFISINFNPPSLILFFGAALYNYINVVRCVTVVQRTSTAVEKNLLKA